MRVLLENEMEKMMVQLLELTQSNESDAYNNDGKLSKLNIF